MPAGVPKTEWPEADLKRFVEGVIGTMPQRLQQAISLAKGLKLHTAVPATSGPTLTNAQATIVLAEMSITADFGGHPIVCLFSGEFAHDTAGGNVPLQLFNAGVQVASSIRVAHIDGIDRSTEISILQVLTPPAGSRTIDVRWGTTAFGIATAVALRRQFVIVEFGN